MTENRNDKLAEMHAQDDESAPRNVHRGQPRIAYRLADRYADRLLHVSGLGWHSWDGGRFRRDEHGAAKRAVLAELRRALVESFADKDLRADVRKCESAGGVAGVLDLAAALEPFAAAVADLDADPYLLNVANGDARLADAGIATPQRPGPHHETVPRRLPSRRPIGRLGRIPGPRATR